MSSVQLEELQTRRYILSLTNKTNGASSSFIHSTPVVDAEINHH